MSPLATEDVLREEAQAIHGAAVTDVTGARLYQSLNACGAAALCLSGGGMRGAAFALGVIEALAAHPRPAGDGAMPVGRAEDSLLAKLHYLSTVSGGGYVGGWLSAWCLRRGFAPLWDRLVRPAAHPGIERPAVSWLHYSQAPQLGTFSADSWTLVALSMRNLILNWLIILPVFCSIILALKSAAIGSDLLTRVGEAWLPNWILLALGIACLIRGLAFTVHNRPSRRPRRRAGMGQFLRDRLLLSVLSAICITQALASDYVGGSVLQNGVCCVPLYPQAAFVLGGAGIGILIYAAGWIAGWPRRRDVRDLAAWAVAGAVYGILVALALYFWIQVPEDGIGIFAAYVFHLVFGIPWILLSQIVAEFIFVAVSSNQPNSDDDREWLGRSAGWFISVALAWFTLTFFVFFGALLGGPMAIGRFDVSDIASTLTSFSGPVAALSGVVSALLGTSSLFPLEGSMKGLRSLLARAVLALAVPVFIAALLVMLSVGLDQVLLGEELVPGLFDQWVYPPSDLHHLALTHAGHLDWFEALAWLLGGFCVCALVAVVASRCININRFSLQALYRNRLIRAILGVERTGAQDALSGLDGSGNPRMHELWPAARPGAWRPFPLINVALSTWQERPSEPFTVTPLHCGSSATGFRRSGNYGDAKGISLGSAMAISGPAASPNRGYHPSPTVTFLMTMFNVRLGTWLGNPGPAGERTYMRAGPAFAIWPLVEEAFGVALAEKKYVYLSDGYHFDSTGVYEMVRRRCRFIIVSDAEYDPEFRFEALGNAVRKIALDLGVTIRFHGLDRLRPRPDGKDAPAGAYHAVGEVDYRAADGGGHNGIILYLKPVCHGGESIAMRSYAAAHPEFPHQNTRDQWFAEGQFESYRQLGFEIADAVLGTALATEGCVREPSLANIMAALLEEATAPRRSA